MLGEVIVVDDASDDGTAAEIKALAPATSLAALSPPWQPGGPKCGTYDRGPGRAISRHRHHGRRRAKRSRMTFRALLQSLGPEGGEPAMAAGIRAGRKGPGSRKLASRFANWIRDSVLDDGCPIPAAGSRSIGATPISSCPIFMACTAICLPFF